DQRHAAPRARRPGAVASAAARLIVCAAAVQIAACAVTVVRAVAAGGSSVERSPQLALAAAFALACAPLAIAARREPRSRFLLATFASASACFARSTMNGLPVGWPAVADTVLRGIWLEAFTPACLW